MYRRKVLSENLNIFAINDVKDYCRITGTVEDAVLLKMVEASIKQVEAAASSYITEKRVEITCGSSMVELIGEVDAIESVKLDGIEIQDYTIVGNLLYLNSMEVDDGFLTVTYTTKRITNAAVDLLVLQLVASNFERGGGDSPQPDWSLIDDIKRIPVL